ncbi:FAD-dependent oxidoreductase [Devosia epidermidihirudinis]|uniref:FAD-dependent oxidoreductase n=1 Tax=Devosia epidermidihirudinis TaxID=1293439 RepID=A0A0F5QGF2_9HYPH|nr:FAD/NAD(P)-binding protein [Devosia epidermidihirudinis]KKC39788.1 FAD-dependent oxidoreductase [Devosia epidermidihirudinis]
MSTSNGRSSVTIIGGGASGVLLAAHLLRDPKTDIRVTLIERRGQFGQGLAYSASQRDHKVNVPARGMSAFADDPEHFWRWLQTRGYPAARGSWVFVPRRLYGVYLEHVLSEAGQSRLGRLVVLSEEAVAVHEGKSGIETVLDNGTSLISRSVVLAVGHETQPARGRGIAVRVGSERDTPLPENAPVMILGSGLSMVDAWLSLADAEHKGPITVVSRNGLLPKGHRDVPPINIDAADVPFGTSLPYFMRWFRALARETEARGGDWRSVVDGLRPYNQRIWKNWTSNAKRQFLRHLRPWWNIHRHRLPPELHERLVRAVGTGQVKLVAAEFLGVERNGDGARAQIRRRGTSERETMDIARVYDCGGVSVDVLSSSNPVIRDLVANGRARPDTFRIGLDVDENCAVVDADGKSHERLLVVGPLTRGRFFEIEAIPDIRVQAATLAARLLAQG